MVVMRSDSYSECVTTGRFALTTEEIAMTKDSHTLSAIDPENPGTTLVLGGTGKTGRRVAARLAQLGAPTRVVARSTSPAFDWHDATSWDDCLADVSAVYLNFAPDLAVPGATDLIQAFVDRAAVAGVRRVVLLSGRGEAEAQACERIVQSSDLAWTIVRASWFMQNFSEGAFASMINDGLIALPARDVPEPFVDVRDIAEVAVAALTEAGHEFEVYEVTGPRMLTFSQLADELSQATGRRVSFKRIPSDVFAAGLADEGLPEDVAWLLNYLFETVLDGRNASVCDGVQRALGRPAGDFHAFVQREVARGTWSASLVEASA